MRSSAESTFDATARRYVCALLSCGLQTGYLLLVERSGAEKGVGTSELLFYNALLSIPFLLTVRSSDPANGAVHMRVRGGVRLGRREACPAACLPPSCTAVHSSTIQGNCPAPAISMRSSPFQAGSAEGW